MTNRRKSRELALHVLYAYDQNPDVDVDSLCAYLVEERFVSEESAPYGKTLARKALESRERIDELLKASATNWDLSRMGAIDRNILRFAVAELLYFKDTPFRVAIDEAVEIAKSYGTDDSAKFVNGIIDAVYKKHAARQE